MDSGEGMETEHETERSPVDRRNFPPECLLHSKQMEDVAISLANTLGKFSSLLWFLAVIGAILSALLGIIAYKTFSVEKTVNDSSLLTGVLAVKVEGVLGDVRDIKEQQQIIDIRNKAQQIIDVRRTLRR
jgi:hypothetical protein